MFPTWFFSSVAVYRTLRSCRNMLVQTPDMAFSPKLWKGTVQNGAEGHPFQVHTEILFHNIMPRTCFQVTGVGRGSYRSRDYNQRGHELTMLQLCDRCNGIYYTIVFSLFLHMFEIAHNTEGFFLKPHLWWNIQNIEHSSLDPGFPTSRP